MEEGGLFHRCAPRFGRQFASHQIPQQFDGIGSDRSHDGHKLDDVDPPLAAFVLGDKGLGPLQPARQLMSGQAGLLAGSHHQGAEGGLI